MIKRRLEVDGEPAFDGSLATPENEKWSLDEKYKRVRLKAVSRLDSLSIITAWGRTDNELKDDLQGWHPDWVDILGIRIQVPLVNVEKDMGPVQVAGDNFLEFFNNTSSEKTGNGTGKASTLSSVWQPVYQGRRERENFNDPVVQTPELTRKCVVTGSAEHGVQVAI